MSENTQKLCIIGGGMTGLTLALLCAQVGVASTVIESKRPDLQVGLAFSGRVSALNLFSIEMLSKLNIWNAVDEKSRGAFRSLQIWDALTGTDILFDSATMAKTELGYNVDNAALIQALWQAAEAHSLIDLRPNTHVERYCKKNTEQVLSLSTGELLSPECCVGADGARSWLRTEVGIDPQSQCYAHHALVTVLKTEQPHQNRGRQVFLPSGPLALLPLFDAHTCAVVWSLPPEEAKKQLLADESAFSDAISEAFGWRLGNSAVLAARQSIPLFRRHAKEYVQPGLALIGDAAHSIHPLAGQGVNLGFRDAVCLSNILAQQHQLGRSLGSVHALERYERARRADNQLMITAMQYFHDSFSIEDSLFVQGRKIGMKLLNSFTPGKRLCMRYAMGLF